MTSKTPAEINNLLLAQLAAESHLNDYFQLSADEKRSRLKLGSNHFDYLPQGADAATAALLGQTRMTDAQVDEFNTRYEVRHHLPNTRSGFSATLLWDRLDNRYVLSFRSTEYADSNRGGDWGRDGKAIGEIGNFGFAVAQIGDMEAYYRQLQANGQLPAGANFMVTGYSLGGHLATVFAQAHANDPGYQGAYTFNSPGHGTLKPGSGSVRDFVNAVYQSLQTGGFLLQTQYKCWSRNLQPLQP